MSVSVPSLGVGGGGGGGVASHLACARCGHLSKSHANKLLHTAACHPVTLDDVTVGRLGNIVAYQSTARLFHCCVCFTTCKDFTKLYRHIIARHCVDEQAGGEGEKRQEGQEDKMAAEKTEEEEKTGEETKMEAEEEVTKEKQISETQAEEVEMLKVEEEERQIDSAIQRPESVPAEDTPEKSVLGPKMSALGGYRCVICGWSKRLRMFVIEHVAKRHDIPKAYASQAIQWREELIETETDRQADGEGEEREEEPFLKNYQKGAESVVKMERGGFSCLICGWKNKLRLNVNSHVTRAHDIPRAYAARATLVARELQPSNDEEAGLSGEMMRREKEATAKVIKYVSNRFVCLICGWKTKLKGFAISHVVRDHEVDSPYACKDCDKRFFLPSRLQQHINTSHRPGRYACPFCCFRSHCIGGFRRHCTRCNARGEGDEEEVEEGEREEREGGEEGGEERKERSKRTRAERAVEDGDEDENENDD